MKARRTRARAGRGFVMQALAQLVEDELAKWQRSESGELELLLATGEAFFVDGNGISRRPRSVAATPAIPAARTGSA